MSVLFERAEERRAGDMNVGSGLALRPQPRFDAKWSAANLGKTRKQINN